MLDALDFRGKVVLVTGGGKGAGRGISQRFLDGGAEVVICGREAPESLLFGARTRGSITDCP